MINLNLLKNCFYGFIMISVVLFVDKKKFYNLYKKVIVVILYYIKIFNVYYYVNFNVFKIYIKFMIWCNCKYF